MISVMGDLISDVDYNAKLTHTKGFEDLFLFALNQEPEGVLTMADRPTIRRGGCEISMGGCSWFIVCPVHWGLSLGSLFGSFSIEAILHKLLEGSVDSEVTSRSTRGGCLKGSVGGRGRCLYAISACVGLDWMSQYPREVGDRAAT